MRAKLTCFCCYDRYRKHIENIWDPSINLKHPMRFESQTHPQNAHIDRYSTRYAQTPSAAFVWDWPREDEFVKHSGLWLLKPHKGSYVLYVPATNWCCAEKVRSSTAIVYVEKSLYVRKCVSYCSYEFNSSCTRNLKTGAKLFYDWFERSTRNGAEIVDTEVGYGSLWPGFLSWTLRLPLKKWYQ